MPGEARALSLMRIVPCRARATNAVRGKWGTTGVLALALEVAGEKSSLTFVSEVSTTGSLSPKFGATLSLSP